MTPLLFIGAAIALAIIYTLKEAFFKPGISSIPGPFIAKFTSYFRRLYVVWKGKVGEDIRDLHAKYGPVVRTGPNTIDIADAKATDLILGIKHDFPKHEGTMKTWWSYQDGTHIPSIVSATDKKEHGLLRRPVAQAYSMTSIVGLEPYVDETIAYFVKRLDEEFISRRKPCDIDNWFPYFAYDAVGEISFSRRLGFLQAGGDADGVLADLRSEMDYRAIVQNVPWIDWWLRRNPVILRLRRFTSRFAQRAAVLIQDRMKNGKPDPNRQDLLSHFVKAQAAHPDVVTKGVLASYTMTPLVAGSDTTSVVLRSALYRILRHPRVLERLRKEFQDKEIQFPPTWKQVQSLHYLDAVMTESLRLTPATSMSLERVVSGQDMQLPDNGPRIPAGTIVGISYGVSALDKTIFGEDASEFRPERWMQAEDESEEGFAARLSAMKHADIGFGYGTRVCMGKNIAKMEMYKVIPTLFQLFDMEFVQPEKNWRIESRFFNRQYDINIWIRWREGMSLNTLVEA
ncbi:hypothetical protein H2203_001673 [Taxawa tesnikishii (nom. ined.)]|nr:hypothetical protein H2203_001673 [Dothideales sp. JES 119]